MNVYFLSLLLAKIVIGEAGFSATEDDVMAHHAVITNRSEARGWSYAGAARLYSPRHLGVKESPRPWISELNRSLTKPPSWPSNVSWEKHRPQWKRVLKTATKAVKGEIEQTCDADHWGGPVVDRDRIDRGIDRGYWEIIDCGNTKNVFLKIIRNTTPDPAEQPEELEETLEENESQESLI